MNRHQQIIESLKEVYEKTSQSRGSEDYGLSVEVRGALTLAIDALNEIITDEKLGAVMIIVLAIIGGTVVIGLVAAGLTSFIKK